MPIFIKVLLRSLISDNYLRSVVCDTSPLGQIKVKGNSLPLTKKPFSVTGHSPDCITGHVQALGTQLALSVFLQSGDGSTLCDCVGRHCLVSHQVVWYAAGTGAFFFLNDC